MSSKLATQTHQLHYPFQEHSRTSFSATISSCRKTAVALKLSKVTFAKFFTSTAPNLMLITPPNDQATAYGTSWKYLAGH